MHAMNSKGKLLGMSGATMCGAFVLLVCSSPAAHALQGAGSTGAAYLSIPFGAASIAMGEVQAAFAGDPFGWIANPAAIPAHGHQGIGITHTEWIAETRFDNVLYRHRVHDKLFLSGAFNYAYRPDIQGYDDTGAETRALKTNHYQAVVGFGIAPVQDFSAGINIKYFQERLDEARASGVACDLGAHYAFTRAKARIGFAIQNIGPDISFNSVREPLPLAFRFGASHSTALAGNEYRLTTALDLVKPRYDEVFACGGVELELRGLLAVRGGYTSDANRPGDGLTMGAGFRLMQRWRLDYAWTPYGDLGSFHHISIFLEL